MVEKWNRNGGTVEHVMVNSRTSDGGTGEQKWWNSRTEMVEQWTS